MTDAQLTGRVVRRGDPDYEQSRQDFNGRFDVYPSVIVFAGKVEDVVHAVDHAREDCLPLAVRSGGHSYEGFSVVQDGLVLDVSELREVKLELEPGGARGKAKVGAGNRLYPLYERLWQDRVTIPGGSCPTVGIAGLTLGGGLGLLGRNRGLTCDKLLELELVDARGRRLRAAPDEHEDLYWASRGGGGGSFGVATSFTFEVETIDQVAVFSLSWPWSALAEVLDAWQNWGPATDQRLFSILHLRAQSKKNVDCVGQLEGRASELRTLLAPLLELNPTQTEIYEVDYLTAVRHFAGLHLQRPHFVRHHPSGHARFKNTSAYASEPVSAAGIEVIRHFLSEAPNGAALLQLDSLGGAIGEMPPKKTAFFHRAGLFSAQYQTYWNDPAEDDQNISWVEAFRREMLPYLAYGAYRNYCDIAIENWPEAYYGDNFERLVAIKTKYDPDNLFRYAQSIPVAK